MPKESDKSELLRKYALNLCTREEMEELAEHLKSGGDGSEMPDVEEILQELDHEQVAPKPSSHKILERARLQERKSKRISNKRKWGYVSYAAMAAIILATTYFLWLQNDGNAIPIPADAITLELSDGTVKVLEGTGDERIFEVDNQVVGTKNDGGISYGKDKVSNELAYHTLKVPYGKHFKLSLSDGTLVQLNAGTELKYPVSFAKGKNREVFLTGEVFLDVAKDSLRPFVVNIPNQVDIEVLGTSFNVSAYPEDGTTDVVLVEGSVKMASNGNTMPKGDSEIILKPGYKGSYDRTTGHLSEEPVPADIYTAWIKGELVFRNMSFANILKKLERHYSVTIINQNKGLGDEVFNASYGKIGLEQLLEDLKQTQKIEYKINGNTITID